ncbi:unnamed protein product [Larinioides sclopetarius]|uniref:Uncharacterized protein n=1 Tax=Larinioides sclopetarius TaxID=280406 RepID=A0AAV1ZJW5_9ARAC
MNSPNALGTILGYRQNRNDRSRTDSLGPIGTECIFLSGFGFAYSKVNVNNRSLLYLLFVNDERQYKDGQILSSTKKKSEVTEKY